jgi:hypothetical protein
MSIGTYGNVTQNRQQDVDEEVGIASTLEEHTQRREDNGEDDLDDVAISKVSKCGWVAYAVSAEEEYT